MSVTVSRRSRTAPRMPRAFLLSVKDAILGRKYELSIAFVDSREMRRLNRTYRKKDVATDVLSFPLASKSGEIVFCMKEVAKNSVVFGKTSSNFLRYLFIHGLCHLKGMRHGSRMERQERKFRKRFSV